jgi:glycosyltransferase involved in cell wall biosynthesis
MARIRLLCFTTRLGGGGAEMQLVRVVNQLDPDEFETTIAVSRGGGEYEERLARGIQVEALAAPWIRSSFAGLALSAWPLRRLVRARKPDVVCSFMDVANVVAALAVEPGPARIACVQNTLSRAYGASERPIARIVPPLVRRTYDRFDHIIALSHGAASDLIANVPAIASRVTVVHNAGVDDAVVARATEPLPGPPPPRPLIVACGRLAPQKGYTYLLDAFAAIRPTTGAHLWIVGEGPERAALEARIRQLGLDDAVRLIGFQQNPYAYMAAADVFVLSSIYEGFGNVIVEAMAAGVPVVATDCPSGPGEIIHDGEDGLLVPPADPAALAAALLRVLDDRALARRLAAAGRRRADDFHVSRSAAGYAAIFRAAAGRSASHEAT